MLKRSRLDVDVPETSYESQSKVHRSGSSQSQGINVPSQRGENSGLSDSYASISGNNYYVFLSFRGADTRKGFVDHLYHRLVDAGLHHPNFVFRDDKDLRFGENIEEIINAIRRSKISIPVISENYANSEWCLRELIEIMECKKREEQKVYPVLYKVKPSDVQEMKGKFGRSFRRHQHDIKAEVQKDGVQALKKAVSSRVFELENIASGYEGDLVKLLVDVILHEHQRHFQPHLPGNLVGTEDRVAELMKLVQIDCKDIRIIGIYGIGGIGKTTLAKSIYKKISFSKFDARSFLKDIRETINSMGMEHVQSLLIRDITNGSGSTIRNPEDGISQIRLSCREKKVLVVLDDVGHQDHVNHLIGGCNFGMGSRIIITCRDQSLLKSEYLRFHLEEMNENESLLLFIKHAFGKEQPSIKLRQLSREIIGITGRIPLALVIIGSLLKGQGQDIWEETREKLRKMPNREVQKVLRISYDSLDSEEQQIFLDIACFSIGIHKGVAIYLWDNLMGCRDSALKKLIDLSLIEVDDDDKLRMHDYLRNLGKAIARPVGTNPWDCSRVWGEEAITIQRSKVENRNIEALLLDEKGSKMFIEQRSFERMPYLKLLHLSKMRFIGDFKGSLSELRWLQWEDFLEECPNSFGADNVHLEKLLILDMSNGFVGEDWRGWRSIEMETLKVLNLSGCSNLENTPDLSALKNLEMLILEDCKRLKQIDPSIGDVTSLVSLNLRECSRLEELPSQLGELKGLVSLDLWGCRRLKELPEEVGELKHLQVLIIGRTDVKEIPFIGSLEKLEKLNAYGCDKLHELPDSITCLVNLKTLDLRLCEPLTGGLPESIGSLVKLQRLLLCDDHTVEDWEFYSSKSECRYGWDDIPHSIGQLKSLIELNLSFAGISKLPESIGDLGSLRIFNILRCKKLKSLPRTISRLGKLEVLDASYCRGLRGGVFIDGLSSLKILRLRETRISSLHNSIGELSCLQELDLEGCQELVWLPGLPANLTVLRVTCQDHTLPELPSGLLRLRVSFCENLKDLPSWSNLKLLSDLCIRSCRELTEIKGLEGLKSLRSLHICKCEKLTGIKGLVGLKSLINLQLSRCKKLSNLDGLEDLESLTSLKIRELDARVQGLNSLKNLEQLIIVSCQFFRGLNISELTRLWALSVEKCQNLIEMEGIGRVKLRSLYMVDCPSIKSTTPLEPSTFSEVSIVGLENCGRLSEDYESWKNPAEVHR